MIPRLSIGESELWAVPAVHNRAVFAEPVNRVCRDPSTRPDAIAVEFSHDAVTAIVAWLKELGAGPGCAGTIPCMLGWVKINRRLHPRHKRAALRLQETHGRPLPELDPGILRERLNFAPVSLLCLSTTDSMIEAIRSAIEWEIPVYGIDLGDVANAERGHAMILDPVLAQDDLESYVRRTERCCDGHRDPVVDGRRERVMAARLKRLLAEYRRVLFTGGLGHWRQLRARLADPFLRPAAEPVQSEGERYRRVVVAPSLAVHQMDLFPDLTARYEAVRRLPLEAPERFMDFASLGRERLAAAGECADPREREAVAGFSQYLASICLVQQRRVPDLFMTLNAACAMVSPAFAGRVGERLVMRALDWTGPHRWPDVPYLCEVRPGAAEAKFPSLGWRARLQDSEGPSEPFYLHYLADNEPRDAEWLLPPMSGSDADETSKKGGQEFSSWVWPPCESLLHGTAYQAVEMASRSRRGLTPEPFAGSLHDGVDVKATLRAHIRGERRIQVMVRSAPDPTAASAEGNDEPTVFLFECEDAVTDGKWETFLACYASDVRRFVRNRERLDRVTRERGNIFVASVHFGTIRAPRPLLSRQGVELRYLYGIVVFSNPCLNPRQAARWLEASDYLRCPILRRSGVNDLFEHYEREHNLSLHWQHWASSLIRLAFPHAKQRVTVIAAPGQPIPATVLREASARRIRLEFVPLSQFPKQRIEAVRHQYLVRPRNVDALDFSEEVQAAFGESPTTHLELLPERVRAQLELGRHRSLP